MKRVILASDTIPFGSDCPFQQSTDTSYYDNFLNERDLEYMRKSKNRDGEVVMMSPSEYYKECAENVFENSSVASLKAQRNADSDLIRQYQEDMKNGDKFPLCYINYADSSQEGLHRMMAAGNVYGWDTKFPVLVVDAVDTRQEELNRIWRYFNEAVYDAEDYTYSSNNWEQEFVEEVEYQMEHRLGEHHDVVIVYRRTEQESEEYGGYAIDIALKEFQDIMHPITVFTPKLKDPEGESDDFNIDDDDLLLDLDIDEWLAELENSRRNKE